VWDRKARRDLATGETSRGRGLFRGPRFVAMGTAVRGDKEFVTESTLIGAKADRFAIQRTNGGVAHPVLWLGRANAGGDAVPFRTVVATVRIPAAAKEVKNDNANHQVSFGQGGTSPGTRKANQARAVYPRCLSLGGLRQSARRRRRRRPGLGGVVHRFRSMGPPTARPEPISMQTPAFRSTQGPRPTGSRTSSPTRASDAWAPMESLRALKLESPVLPRVWATGTACASSMASRAPTRTSS